jgi:hypothetical protein
MVNFFDRTKIIIAGIIKLRLKTTEIILLATIQ